MATPNDRHPDDGCNIAYNKWWLDLCGKGDPSRSGIGNLIGEAFLAGWEAAMSEVKEAEAFLRKIRTEEAEERRKEADLDAFKRSVW